MYIMEKTITLENIKCHGCGNSIKKAVENSEHLKFINLDIEKGELTIEGSEDHISDLVKKLHSMGYPEPGKGNLLNKAVSYVSCAIGRMD
jgi:copper chaperone